MDNSRTDPFSEMIEVACGAAIRKAMNVTDFTSRRLLTVKEVAVYLAVSEREVYNMLSKNELRSVRHGRRLMVDLRDLERWIEGNKF